MKKSVLRRALALCLSLLWLEARADLAPTIDFDTLADAAVRAPLALQASASLTWPVAARSVARAHAAWPPTTRQEFIAAVWPHAEKAAKQIGVTTHAIVAQAALESGWGRRVAKNSDGEPTFNLFGIKAGPNWAGDRIEVATHEYVRGKRRPKVADFRAYESIADCFADYVALLKANPRYAAAVKHGGTSRHFAARLQRAGYSTDPHYARKVHEIANSAVVRSAKKRLPGAKRPEASLPAG